MPAICESRPVSSRKLQAGTSLGEEGSASDTRRCFKGRLLDDAEAAGNGALNENVDVEGGLHVIRSAVDFSMIIGMVATGYWARMRIVW